MDYNKAQAEWHQSIERDLNEKIDEIADRLHAIQSGFESIIGQRGTKKKRDETNFKLLLLDLLRNHCTELSAGNFESVHYNWWDTYLSISSEMPAKIKKRQHPERFTGSSTSTKGRILKPFKIFFFNLGNLPLKLFKKTPKPWMHVVKVRPLFNRIFFCDFLPHLARYDQLITKTFTEVALEIKIWEESGRFDDSLESVDVDSSVKVLRKRIKKELNEYYDSAIKRFENEMLLAGTIEYDNHRLRESNERDRILREKKKWSESYNSWNNVAFIEFEDWRSDLEIQSLILSVNELAKTYQNKSKKWKDTLVKSFIQEMSSYVEDELKKFQHKNIDLEKEIKASQYRLNKEFNMKLLLPFQDSLSKNSLLNMLDQLDYEIRSRIDGISENYYVVKDADNEGPYRGSDMVKVSNLDLISFEIRPKLTRALEKIKSEVRNNIVSWTQEVGDLDEIITYSLNTAISEIDNENAEPQKMVIEGIERSVRKVQSIQEQLEKTHLSHLEEFNGEIQLFTSEIDKLTDNDNVRSLQFRLSKARAIEKSEEYKKRLRAKWGNWRLVLLNLFKVVWNRTKRIYGRLRGNIILSEATGENIRGVSDFISASDEKIASLPLMYRRLYAIEPLTNDFLFEGREKEIKSVAESFEAWKIGRYASALLVGEKWSGLTTLVEHLQNNLPIQVPVSRFSGKQYKYSGKSMIEWFSESIDCPTTSASELISKLNESPGRMIILEDIQHLFIRKIGGLKDLNDILRVISSTQKKVFWLSSISLLAFRYLEKTMRLSGVFSYVVHLEELKDDDVRAIILKRNRISGFEIKYEPDERILSDKKFKKLDEKGKQQYLEARFFRQLNSFSKSNISMALQYWLLSTREIDQHGIVISAFQPPDFSFLYHMDDSRCHILYALLLHDGLETRELADVLYTSYSNLDRVLLEMEEDGLIGHDGQGYRINTLIFRPAIQLLQSRNMIL